MSTPRVVAAIALGSNLGDRAVHLDRAVREIGSLAGVTRLSVSGWIETDPEEGAAGQPRYLNGAMLVETRLGPRALLKELMEIERAHDRRRDSGARHAPRTLDLDLLVHGDRVIDEAGLVLPHPRLRARAFVLEPLVQIAPDLEVPADAHGPAQSVRDLWRALRPRSSHAPAGPSPATAPRSPRGERA